MKYKFLTILLFQGYFTSFGYYVVQCISGICLSYTIETLCSPNKNSSTYLLVLLNIFLWIFPSRSCLFCDVLYFTSYFCFSNSLARLLQPSFLQKPVPHLFQSVLLLFTKSNIFLWIFASRSSCLFCDVLYFTRYFCFSNSLARLLQSSCLQKPAPHLFQSVLLFFITLYENFQMQAFLVIS